MPNGTKSSTFWTTSGIDTRRPVSGEISGFRETRASFAETNAGSDVKWKGIVVP